MEDEESASINTALEKKTEVVKEVISIALLARQNSGVKVRWPIRNLYIETKSHEVNDAISDFRDTISKMVNVKEVKIVEVFEKGEVSSGDFSLGKIHVDKTIDEELYSEGIFNEVKRRIQILRKEAKLIENDVIEVYIDTEEEILAILKKKEKEMADAVNAKQINYKAEKEMIEYNIDGRNVRIKIQKK
jgi:hypothetical protein